MILLPTKPLNSTIKVENKTTQTIISWKNPRGSSIRYLAAIFMLAWLGGWVTGLYSVAETLLNGDMNPFLVFWMIGWTIGGIVAMRSVYLLVRPTKPARLTLDSISLNYQTGTSPFAGYSWENQKEDKNDLIKMFQKTKDKCTISKKDAGDVKLDRVGERQRLTIDYGSERVEIGEFLQEPEREWLLEVLKKWRTQF